MKDIIYLKGDATEPKISGSKVIAHICNNEGRWGGGFVLSVSKKWKEPERLYKSWIKAGTAELGEIQLVKVEDDIVVANMIAQESFVSVINPVTVRYEALKDCLKN